MTFPQIGGGMYLQKSVTVEKNWRDEFSEQSRMGMEPLGEAMIEYQTQTRKQEPTFVPSPSPVSLVKPFQTEWNPPTLGGGSHRGGHMQRRCQSESHVHHGWFLDRSGGTNVIFSAFLSLVGVAVFRGAFAHLGQNVSHPFILVRKSLLEELGGCSRVFLVRSL